MTRDLKLAKRRTFTFCVTIGIMTSMSIASGQNSDTSAVEHSQHAAPASPEVSQTDHSQHGAEVLSEPVSLESDHSDHQPVMNHEDMNMEAVPAPGVRSPHAYSGGYTREQGPYALPIEEQHSLADEQMFRRLLVNRLENIDSDTGDTSRYDVQAWYGKTYNRFVLKAEGEISGNKLEDSRTELLWSRASSKFWDTQIGARVDNGHGPSRNWLALGVQGLAPYWFEVHATAFVGENGRTAFGFEAEYEGRITQRLTLKPRIDVNAYGKDDPERGIGSGFSDAILGLRVQYQITRQLVPYIGIERKLSFGETADLLGAFVDDQESRWIAGLRFWF
jgi:copper resistance protein B